MEAQVAMAPAASSDPMLAPPHQETGESREADSVPTLKEALDCVERRLVMEALIRTKGNQTKAARVLGITDRIMGLRVRKYGIHPREYRAAGDDSS
jgi:Nif-specific regulatory protein